MDLIQKVSLNLLSTSSLQSQSAFESAISKLALNNAFLVEYAHIIWQIIFTYILTFVIVIIIFIIHI